MCAAILRNRQLSVKLPVGVVRNVSEAIVEVAVRMRWVGFLATPSEREAVRDGFLWCGSQPGVTGCVDNTYFSVKSLFRNARGRVRVKES